MKLFSKAFWIYASERAVKTAAQSALSLMTVDYTGILAVDFKAIGSAAGLAALLSVLTALTSFTPSVPDAPVGEAAEKATTDPDIALDVDYELPGADIEATQAIEVETS